MSEMDDFDDQAPPESAPRPRGRPRKVETDALLAEKAEIEAQIEASPQRDAIRAALEAGRERNDPRKEEEATREGGRVPLGQRRKRLDAKGYEDQLEGYVGRWILDDGGRLTDALQAGYLPVFKDKYAAESEDLGTWVCRRGGTNAEGKPQRQYLMKLRKDLYEEDQRAKKANQEQIMKGIVAPKSGPGADPTRYGNVQIAQR